MDFQWAIMGVYLTGGLEAQTDITVTTEHLLFGDTGLDLTV